MNRRTNSVRAKDTLLTAEEYAALPDDDVPTELVRGRVVREAMAAHPHGRLQLWLGHLLTQQIEAHGWPLECATAAGCLVEERPDTVRGPDVVVVRAGRPTGRADYVAGGPELAVEILSRGNRRAEIQRRTREYLAAGTALVWVVDQKKRTLTVHRANALPSTLSGEDRLDGGTLMPDLAITVAQLFR